LRRSLLRNFIEHQGLTTTLAKAKEIRPYLEKLISLARHRSLAHIRRALAVLGHDRALVTKLFDEIGSRVADRPGGYTRILKFAKPRLGDAAPRARLELVTEELAPAEAAQPAVVEQAPVAEESAPEEEAVVGGDESQPSAAQGSASDAGE
jgi:large subunit ribosomal protein L17